MSFLVPTRSAVLAFVLGVLSGVCLWVPNSSVESISSRSSHQINGIFVFEKWTLSKTAPLICCDCSTLRLAFTVMSTSDKRGARKRSLVRVSWPQRTVYKHPPAVQTIVKFVLGTKGLPKSQFRNLAKEQAKYGDLLLLPNHHDTYNQLTEKTRQTLQWAYKNIQFDYLIKTDDDVVIRLDKMVDALRHMRCPELLYWGHTMLNISVLKSGKWKETKWTACPTYLPYVSGTAYVLGRQVVRLVVRYSEHLSHFLCEDVSMGFWLAPYHLTRQIDWRFHLKPTCRDSAIQAHQDGSIESLQSAIHALVKTGKICSEKRKRKKPRKLYQLSSPLLSQH